MSVSIDEFEESPSVVEQRKTERRAHVRRACEGEATPRIEGGTRTTSWSALVRNISPEGMGLLLATPLAAGTLLTVEIRLRGQSRTLRVKVVHCAGQDDGWLAGCQFLTPISETELADWLGSQ